MPTRLAKQLGQIMRGGIAIGMNHDEALALALRCARDSVPQLRLEALKDLYDNVRLVTLRREEIVEVEEVPGKPGQPPQTKTRKTGKYRYFYQLTERSCEGVKALQ